MLTTGQILRQVIPSLPHERAEKLSDMINYRCPKYGIDTPDILHEFIANLAHESGGFAIKDENLSYSAERLLVIFESRFKDLAHAKQYARNPEKLGNYVYGKRMGNNQPGDGYKFRGGGFCQLTGREIYEEYKAHVAFSTIDELAKCIRTDDYYALDSSCWFFANKKKLLTLASNDNFKLIIKMWNGGYNGLHDRNVYYYRAKKFIV